MLTQVHTVDVTPTASVVEAALLETDEIKRLAPPYNVQLLDVFLPIVILFVVLIILQLLVALLLPLRWGKIRGEFQRQLEVRLRSELSGE